MHAQSNWYWRNDTGGSWWGDANKWWNGSSGSTLANSNDYNMYLNFGGTGYATSTNSLTNVGVRGIIFESGSEARTLDNNLLKIGFGGTGKIENNSSNTQTINLTLSNAYGNNLEINAVAGALVINNIYLGSSATVDLYGSNNNTLNFKGLVSGSATMNWINTRDNRVVFSASNSMSGTLNVYRGFLIASNAAATFGSSTINIGQAGQGQVAEVWFGTGGTAQTNALSNNIVFNSESANNGANRAIVNLNTSGTNTITGTVANNNSGLTAKLFLTSGGTLRFSNVVSGLGGFYMDSTGGGTLELSAANTFSGGLFIDNGTVKLSGASATAGSGTLALGAVGGGSSATILYSGTSGGITLTNNTMIVRSGAGARRILSENTTGTNTFTGTINLSNSLTISNVSGGVFNVSGAITNTNGSLTKSGAGNLLLSASNSFSGGIIISEGTLSITNGNALGTGQFNMGNGSTNTTLSVASNATITNVFQIYNAAAAAVIEVTTNTATTISGRLTQDGAKTNTTKFGKAGAGTLILSSASSDYNGQIQIGNGTLVIGVTGGLGTNTSTGQRGIDLGFNVGDVNQTNNVAVLASNNVTVGQSFYVTPNTNSATRTIGIAGAGTNTFNNEFYLDGILTVDAGANATDRVNVSGNILNTGGLVKTNAGILVLSGSGSTFSGGVTLGQGTLRVGANSALGAGNFTINGGVFASDGSDARTNTNNITMGGNVQFGDGTGTGALTLSNINLAGTTRTFTVSNSTTVAGVISNGSGTPGLTKAGSGTLTLSGANTYSGATTINAGELSLGANNALSDSTAVSLTAGTLNFGGFTDTVNSFTISGGTFTNGTLTATNGYALQGGTVNGNLGAGTINATASTALNGTAAATTVNVSGSGNTLTLGSAGRLASGATVNVTNSGTLAIAGAESVTSLVLSNGTLNGTGQTLTASSAYTLAGTTNTVNANLGSGTVTASGGTTAFNGTNAGALTLSGGSVTTGGANKLSDTGAVTVNTGTLTIGGSDTVGALSGSGGTVSVNTGATLTTSFNTASNNYAGTISGAGGFAKAGSGTLSLSGDASGIGTISVSAGRLQIGTGSTTGTIGNDSVSLSSGANLAFNRSDNITYNGVISGSGGTVTKLGSGVLTISNTQTYTGATTVSAGTLSYMGTNTSTATTVQSGATLAGSGSLGAVTIASGGTLSPGTSPGTLSVGNLTWEGNGNYNWQVYDAAGAAGTGYDTISGNSLNITATEGNKFNINLWSLSGIGPDVNGNAINFTNTNGYTWTLGSFTNGITNFSSGVFSINTAATNGTTGFSNSFTGTFSIYTTNSTNLVLAYTAADTTYNVTVSSGSTNQNLATGGTNQFVGAAALNKLGAGTLVMTNTNTYSGVTTIVEGAISIVTNAPSGTNGALGAAITDVLVGTATNAVAAGFDIGAANVTNSRNLNIVAGSGVADRTIGTTNATGTAEQAGGVAFNTNATLYAVSGGTMLYSGALSGSGNLTISNSGTSVFSGSNSYTGTTTILTNATLRIANANALGGTGSGTTVNAGGTLAISNGITSAEGITVSGAGVSSGGAIRNISGNNTLSGGITLAAASQINADSGTLLTLSGGINGANFGLTVGGAGNTTISGALTNSSGSLTKTNAGTLTLTGANNYSGGTLVGQGTVVGNTTSLQGTITNNGAVIFDQSTNGTYSSAMSGTGALTKTNAATLTLSVSNSYSGGTTVGQGGVVVANNNALGTGTVALIDGTSLSSDSTARTLSNNMTVQGVLFGGTGALTINGNITNNRGAAITITNNNSGGLTISNFSMSHTGVGRNVTFAGSGNTTINGIISNNATGSNSPAALTLSGTGTTTLNGANTFSGGLTLSNGTLVIGNNSALGAGGATFADGVTVNSDATARNVTNNISFQNLQIGGTGALTLGGTLTLANTPKTITNNNSSGLTIGAINLSTSSENRTLTFAGTGNTTVTGVIANGGTSTGGKIILNASGTTLTLGGANTYSGVTTNLAGTLLIANNTALGDTTGNTVIASGATLALSNNINSAEAITISGTGVGGNGVIRNIAGNNTNSGTITLDSTNNRIQVDTGTSLTLGAIANGVSTNNLTLSANGTLRVTGAFTGAGTSAVLQKDGAGSLVISNSGTTGQAQLQVGGGTVTVEQGSYSTSTSTGTRALDLGISSTGDSTNNVAFYANSGVTISNSIYVAPNTTNNALRILGTESTNGTATFDREIYLGGNLTVSAANGGTALFSGNIINSGDLTKTNGGTVVLSGANTFGGSVNVAQGTLVLSNASSTAMNDTNAVTIANGATLSLGTSETVGSITGAGNIALLGNQLIAGGNGSSTEFSGIMSSTSSAAQFVKFGSGTLTLSGANTMNGQLYLVNGTTLFTVNQGSGFTNTINLGETNGSAAATVAFGGSGLSVTNPINVRSGNNGTMTIEAQNATGTLTLGGSLALAKNATLKATNGGDVVLSGAVDIGTSQLFTGNSSGSDITISGNISANTNRAGELLVDNTGTVYLTGNNSANMKITLSQGTLVVGNITNLGNPTTGDFFGNKLNLNGGTLSATNDVTTGSLFGVTVSANGSTLLASSGKTLKFVDYITDVGAGTAAYTLGIGGGGTVALEKATGENLFNGNMTFSVTNGTTLSTPNLLALGNSSTNIVSLNNGTFAYTGNTGTASQRFTIGTNGGTINVSTTNQTLSLTNSTTLTGTLTKSGDGILNINRANTGTGGANITGGILRIGNASALGTGGTVAVSSGATLQLSNGISFARDLSLSGNGTVSGALLSVNGANTNSSTITLANGGAVVGVSDGSLVLSGGISGNGGANRLTLDTYGVAGTPLTVSGAYTNSSGGLTKIGGGVAVLSGANTYSGGTVISGGTLQVGAGGATGQLGTGNITNNATLAINRTGTLAIADAISGTGVLTKSGAGTLTLTGANTYGGGTLISAGAIAGTTAGIQGNITNNGAVIFDQSTTGTYGGIISGAGTLAMTNTGTVTLTNANTFSGGVTVNGGTLVLNRSGGPALGGTNAITINTNATLRTDAAGQIVGAPLVTVSSGGTYDLNGFNQTNALTGAGNVSLGAGTLNIQNTGPDTFSGVISGSGGVTKTGGGTQTLSGTNTYTGATTITEGQLTLGADNAISDSSAVTVNGGALALGTYTDTIQSITMSAGSITRQGAGSVLTVNGASTLTGGTVSYTAAGGISFGSSLQLGGVTFSYGSATTPSGTQDTIRLGGDVGYASSATGQALFTNTSTGVAAFDLGGAQRTFNLTNSGTLGAGTPEMAVYWNVRDGGLTKDGTGALLLGRANTHTNTTLTAGDLLVGDNAAVGTGTVNLNGGTFASFDGTARTITNALTIGGDITLGQASGGTGVLTFSNANLGGGTRSITAATNVNFVGAVTNGSLTKAGNATLALSNTGTSLNNLNITAGTVAVQTNATVGGLAGSGTGALSLAGGTLTVNASTNSTFGQVISGAGGLTKTNVGTLNLSGNNSYAGATTINGGTLAINGTNTSSAVTINSGGTLAGTGLAGATTVKSGGRISPGNSIGTLSVDTLSIEGGSGYTWEVANVTGSAGTDYDQIKVGDGTGAVSFSATAGNPFTIYLTSYTGFTNWDSSGTFSWNIIDWGTVTTFDASAFAVNTNNFSGTVSGAFTFANTNGYLVMTYTAGTPTYDTNSGTWSAGFVPSLANGNNAMFDGPGGNATNNISTNTLTSIGNLAFSNTSGAYTLTADSGSAGFDAASRLLVAGNIVNDSTNAQTINMALGFDADRTIDAAAGNMTFGSTISNGVGLTFTGISNNTVSGAISGAGTITKTGTGSLFLNGANTYTGATTISNGVVQLGNAAGLGATNGGTTVISGATLDLNGYNVTGEALSLAGTGVGGNGALINSSASAATNTGAVTLTGNTTVGTTGNMTLSGAVGGAYSLTKIGAATLNLSSSNAYTGGLVISEGAVFAGNNNAFGSGTITINGGGIGSTNSRTIANNLVAGGDFFMGGSTTTYSGGLDLGGTNRAVTFSNSATFNGVISNGALTIKAATLTQDITFAASNTYTGGTIINGGDVNLTGAGALYSGGDVTIAPGAGTNSQLHIGAISADSTTIGSLAATNSAGAKVILDTKTLIAGGNNSSTTFGGVIEGTGGFTKAGTGTMTFTRASTYTGATTISNGEIALSVGGALANSSAINLAGATARYDISAKTAAGETNGSLAGVAGSVVNLGTNKTLNVGGDNSSTTFAGILTNTGSLTKSGLGTMTLSGANTFSGGSTLSAGVLRVAHNSALGSGALTALSNTVLEVTNGITVTNNLSVYSVKFLNSGNTLSGTITNNNTVYDVASGTTNTISGFVTGSGGVELIGGGQLNITGTTNNYTGNTTISNGTLQISTLANSNTVSSIGVSNNVTLAGANATNAILDYTGGNVTTDRAFVMDNGGGTINMASSSTEMTLTGSASGSGKLIVGEGTLILSGATNAFAPGSIQVDSGATLQLAANNQIGDTTGLILNGGTFRIGTATTGFSETLGTLTLSASSTIDLGAWTTGVRQLTFANSSAITWTGTLTITNWQGVALQSSDVAEILFGTGGLTSTQLGQVYWANQDINGGALIGGGELVPIPEPRVYAAAVALLAAVGWRERKRLRELLTKAVGKKSSPPKA